MTIINIILDMSGSMADVWDATIEGYNEYIRSLKGEDGNEYQLSLTTFDTMSIDHPYTKLDLDKVPKLTKETYIPRMGTPLYDAVCGTLQSIGKVKKTDKSLVVIITDGLENSSKEYTEKDLKRMKASLEKKGNWSFVYLGANQDAWEVAGKWGFSQSNTSTYNTTANGTQAMFTTLASSSGSFVRGSSLNSNDFFSDAQQKHMKETK